MIFDTILDYMVKGIETDDKKVKKISKKDEKWLSKDLNDIKDTVENYIDSIRPRDEEDLEKAVTGNPKKTMPFIRIIAVILGIIGIFSLLFGLYSLAQEYYVLGIIGVLIGFFFLLTLILFELYG